MRSLAPVLLLSLLPLAACPATLPNPDDFRPADGGPGDDGGPVPADAGPQPDDAGPQPGDAGPQPNDAGPQPSDAGPQPQPDAGPQLPDAGPDPQPIDGGPVDPPVQNGVWTYTTSPGGSGPSPFGFTTNFQIQDNTGTDELIVVALVTSPPVNTQNNVGVSGFVTSWTRRARQCSSRQVPGTGVEIWTVRNPQGNGAISVSLDYPPNEAALIAVRYTNVNGSTPVGATVKGNTQGVDASCFASNPDLDTGSYTLTFNPAYGSRVFSAAALLGAQHTAGAGFSELDETGVGDATIAVQEAVVLTQPFQTAGSFNGDVDWAVAAIELPAP